MAYLIWMSLNNISITSMAIGVNVVADVNICTTACLPLIIRMRMRNNYAWTPVFDNNKGTELSLTKYNRLSFWTYSIPLHELILLFASERKMTYVTLEEWGTWRDHRNPFKDTTLVLVLWLSGRARREDLWLEAMTREQNTVRSGLHDKESNFYRPFRPNWANNIGFCIVLGMMRGGICDLEQEPSMGVPRFWPRRERKVIYIGRL